MSKMKFKNIGGTYQFPVDGPEALARIHEIDPARWAVTSVPSKDLQCDQTFLTAIDTDGDGRVRVSHVLTGRDWLFKMLRGRGQLVAKTETLNLADIDTSHAEGQALHSTAVRVLDLAGVASKATVTLAQVRDFQAGYKNALANGDGIVCPSVIPSPEASAFAAAILATVGSQLDASGNPGVGAAELDKYIAGSKAYDEWEAKGADVALLPFGDATAALSDLVAALDTKMQQFFWQCDLVRAEPTSIGQFKLDADRAKALKSDDPAEIQKHLEVAPLQLPTPDGALHFDGELNPLYEARLQQIATLVLPRLEPTAKAVDRAGWAKLSALFDSYRAWIATKPVEPFGANTSAERNAWINGPLPDQLRGYFAQDLAAAPEIAQIANLEKLVLFQRWLLEFTNNFVNVTAIYDPRVLSLTEMGALVVDGRRLEFSVRVADKDAHKKIATESRIFLVYAEVTEKAGGPALYTIACPVTRGERGRLIVGKRGVFYARSGKVYDAQILEVIEHPISLLEAIKAPFRRISEFIGKKIEEFAASRAAAAETKGLTAVTEAPAAAAAPPKKMDPAQTAGILAGGGLALAAVGSAMAYVVSALSKISLLDVVLVIGSIFALIAFFAGLLGWLKLRLRNLGPLLEASGWAINPHMKVGGPLARLFTRRPMLPADHEKAPISDLPSLPPDDDEGDVLFRRIALVILGLVLAVPFLLGALWYIYPEGFQQLRDSMSPKQEPAAQVAPAAEGTKP
jgi:hypothetical protein